MRQHEAYAAVTRCVQERLANGQEVDPQRFGKELVVMVLTQMFQEVLSEGRVALPTGFGSLYLKTIPARRQKGRDGQMVDLPERINVAFSAGERLKRELEKRGKQEP